MTMTITLPKLHSAQWEVAQHAARFKVLAAGRRFGKTLLGSGECVRDALNGGRAWWVAPSYKVAAVGWRGLKILAVQIPGTQKSEVERMITFPGGGVAQVRSGDDPDSLRGDGLTLVVLDEAAFMKPAVWSEAIRPALSDRQGRALFISTPNGRNWFWSLWMLGQDPYRYDWQSWRFPTQANPFIHKAEVQSAKELLTDRIFQQEYMAEFLDDGGAVFRNLTACLTADRHDGPIEAITADSETVPAHEYVFGVDWGKSDDFTVIAVIDKTAKRLVALERFNQVNWSLQRGRLAALAAHWHPVTIWAEENSIGGPNIEALQNEGLPVIAFTTTASSKGPLIESLALAFERAEIGLYNDPVLMGELQAYTMKRLPSGRFQYEAPSGMHDDCVIALALAWHGATQPSGSGLIAFV